MTIELVRVTTSDGYHLDGALHLPAAGGVNPFPFDGVLLVHGTGGNFYTHGVLESFALQAAERGVAALRINTRGHDYMSLIRGIEHSSRGGATYEVLSDCRHD